MSLTVNGARHALMLDPRTTLLDLMREHLDLTGTKKERLSQLFPDMPLYPVEGDFARALFVRGSPQTLRPAAGIPNIVTTCRPISTTPERWQPVWPFALPLSSASSRQGRRKPDSVP